MVVSKNETILVNGISVLDYYNKYISTIHSKFSIMSDSRVTSLCPFHNDTDPSFHYWKKKNIFHCFGCGVGGNVVRLHQLVRQKFHGEKLDKAQSIESLARLWGIKIEEDKQGELTVFQTARQTLSDREVYIIPKDKLSLNTFRQLNKKVITSSISLDSKVYNFAELDARAALFLIEGLF